MTIAQIGKQIGLVRLAKIVARINKQIGLAGLTGLATRSKKTGGSSRVANTESWVMENLANTKSQVM
jgi:hypothetical protein